MTINHKCPRCTAGEPCATCGGNIETTHPAYQSLSFALVSARARQPCSGSWRASLIEDMVARAALPGDASTRAIRGFIGAASHRYQIQQRSDQFWAAIADTAALPDMHLCRDNGGAVDDAPGELKRETREQRKERQDGLLEGFLERWKNAKKFPPNRRGGSGGGGRPRLPEDAAKRKCCPEDLVYPEFWYPFTAFDLATGRTKYAIHFEAEALYSPDPVPPCYCECCAFEQYVDFGYKIGNLRSGGTNLTQDCLWFDRRDPEKTIHNVVTDPPREEDTPYVVVICPDEGTLVGDELHSHPHMKHSLCKDEFCDEPGLTTEAQNLNVLFEMWGVIVDTCRNRIPVRVDQFLFLAEVVDGSMAAIVVQGGFAPGEGKIAPILAPNTHPWGSDGCA